jgi:hypothetical protein
VNTKLQSEGKSTSIMGCFVFVIGLVIALHQIQISLSLSSLPGTLNAVNENKTKVGTKPTNTMLSEIKMKMDATIRQGRPSKEFQIRYIVNATVRSFIAKSAPRLVAKSSPAASTVSLPQTASGQKLKPKSKMYGVAHANDQSHIAHSLTVIEALDQMHTHPLPSQPTSTSWRASAIREPDHRADADAWTEIRKRPGLPPGLAAGWHAAHPEPEPSAADPSAAPARRPTSLRPAGRHQAALRDFLRVIEALEAAAPPPAAGTGTGAGAGSAGTSRAGRGPRRGSMPGR